MRHLFFRKKKTIMGAVIFFLAAFWIYSGWPRIWQNPPYPPGPEMAKAAGAPWYNTNWKYRTQLTINHAKVASSSPTSTFANFPVLVNTSSTGWKYSGSGGHVANASGFDILFTDGSSTAQLNHEIEQYASSTGALIAWIKIPALSTTTDISIYMYYGNNAVTSTQENPTGVWNSNYIGVWHMDNTLGDSTVNALMGTNVGASTNATTTPIIDSYRAFNGTSAWINVTPYNAVYNVTGTITVQAWIKPTTIGLDQKILGNESGVSTQGGYKFGVYTGNMVEMEVRDSANAPTLNRAVASGTVLAANNWYSVAGRFSGGTGGFIDTFVNGNQERVMTTAVAMGSSTGTLKFATEPFATGTLLWHGNMDEIRVSKVILSKDWIKTEYNNQSSPTTFITAAAEEALPPFYTETSYGWYLNQNATTTGPVLAPQNTSTTAPPQGTPFRLRLLIQALLASSTPGPSSTFKLQYATSTPGGCTTSTGKTFLDIATSSGDLRFFDNPAVADGILMAPSSTDPSNGLDVRVTETYDENNPFVTTSTIGIGQDGRWDFPLVDVFSPGATTYCIRAVKSDGTLLDAYNSLPEIQTDAVPSVSGITVNGNQSISLSINTTTLVQATATVTDLNGFADIGYVTSTLYLSSAGPTCATDNNSCYPVASTSCPLSACGGSVCTVTCSYNVQYFADPTDSGTPWAGQTWNAAMTAFDDEGATSTASTTGVSLLSLLAMTVTPSINYGTLSPGQTISPLNQPTVVTSTGNVSLNVTIYGVNMTAGANSVPVGQQRYATSGVAYASGTALGASPGVLLPLNMKKTTSTASPSFSTIQWGIAVPNPQPSGNYTGADTFIAVMNSLPWP
jgi:hypothetical protein